MFQPLKKLATLYEPLPDGILQKIPTCSSSTFQETISKSVPFKVPRRDKRAVNDQNPHHWLPKTLI